jgi:hypothetical protein
VPEGDRGLPVNRRAVYSILFGATAFLSTFFVPFLPFVLGVCAVTTGVHGRREIALSRGEEGGDMLAIVGITTGATTLGLLLLSFLAGTALGG